LTELKQYPCLILFPVKPLQQIRTHTNSLISTRFTLLFEFYRAMRYAERGIVMASCLRSIVRLPVMLRYRDNTRWLKYVENSLTVD